MTEKTETGEQANLSVILYFLKTSDRLAFTLLAIVVVFVQTVIPV